MSIGVLKKFWLIISAIAMVQWGKFNIRWRGGWRIRNNKGKWKKFFMA